MFTIELAAKTTSDLLSSCLEHVGTVVVLAVFFATVVAMEFIDVVETLGAVVVVSLLDTEVEVAIEVAPLHEASTTTAETSATRRISSG
jgi:hypothetical protein